MDKVSVLVPFLIAAQLAASAPAEMPEVFRDAAKSSGGVMSFVTALEDEAFRTGSREAAEARRWDVDGMVVQIDRFRDRDQLLANVPGWLLPPAERGKTGAEKGMNAAASYAYADMLDSAARLYGRDDYAARAAYMREALKGKGMEPPAGNAESDRLLPAETGVIERFPQAVHVVVRVHDVERRGDEQRIGVHDLSGGPEKEEVDRAHDKDRTQDGQQHGHKDPRESAGQVPAPNGEPFMQAGPGGGNGGYEFSGAPEPFVRDPLHAFM